MSTRIYGWALCLIITLCGCGSQDEEPRAEVVITARALVQAAPASAVNGRLANLHIEDLSLSIKNIEFRPSGSASGTGAVLKGPFQLPLVDGGSEAEQVVTVAQLSPAEYGALGFEMDEPGSLSIQGSLNGRRFKLWAHSSEALNLSQEISCTTAGMDGRPLYVKLFFNFDYLLSEAGGMNLSAAEDRDMDGLIEIGPGDEDGNAWIAESLPPLLEKSIHLVAGR